MIGEGAQSQTPSLPTHKSVDELRQLLLERHDAAVDREDPVLLLYTIMRVCLDEQSEFKDTFLNMIAEAFEDGSNKISEHLIASLPQLSDAISIKTSAANIAAVEHTSVIMDRTLSGHQRLLRWVVLLIVVCVLSTATSLYVLFSILS
ncbi:MULTISPECIES: hypothetical protein [Alphaproteobacteria]|uniref:hypothetical protein n=1 Tax=Alphaproteobacteria TaxID=28211 RepID=UPI00326792DF